MLTIYEQNQCSYRARVLSLFTLIIVCTVLIYHTALTYNATIGSLYTVTVLALAAEASFLYLSQKGA